MARIFAARGHLVIATEPDNAGFGLMSKLNSVIDKSFEIHAKNISKVIFRSPEFYPLTAQDLFVILKNEPTNFDFIYCANVVEHIAELSNFFSCVVPLIKLDGEFRFICPNYAFPYEPHFGFITFFSKKFTFKMQKKKILNSHINDALLFWQEYLQLEAI